MYSLSEENYLKSIFHLSGEKKEDVSTNSIAEYLCMSAASVSDMIKKLSEKKLIVYQKYKGVKLSDDGEKVALATVRSHRLWETFLHDKLEFSWHEVHEIAEQLEHIKSEKLVDRLEAYLGFPTTDPHGEVIPSKDGIINSGHCINLTESKVGDKLIVCSVKEHSEVFLNYINKINLTPDKQIEILEINDFDKSMKIHVKDCKTIDISSDVAKNIVVKPS